MSIENTISGNGQVDLETAVKILIEKKKDQNQALKKILKLLNPDAVIEDSIDNGQLTIDNDTNDIDEIEETDVKI